MPSTSVSSPWDVIAQQHTWWVPRAGWELWSSSLDLAALEPGVEKLKVASMPNDYAAAAAGLLFEQLVSHVLVGKTMLRMQRTHHTTLPHHTAKPTSPTLDHLAAIRYASRAPLMQALCSRPQELIHHLEHPALEAVLSRLDASLHPSKFSTINDALIGHLLKRAADSHLDLFSTLLRDNVQPGLALEVINRINFVASS